VLVEGANKNKIYTLIIKQMQAYARVLVRKVLNSFKFVPLRQLSLEAPFTKLPRGLSLLNAPHMMKTTWLKSVVKSIIPFTAHTISDRGRSFDSMEISVSYFNQTPLIPATINGESQDVGKRKADDSWLEICLPFSQHPELRDSMATSDGYNMRFGKLFEILDALAADVAYRHCGGKKDDLYVVTAGVNRMKMLSKISLQNDFKLQGYLTFVGKSSLEASNLLQIV